MRACRLAAAVVAILLCLPARAAAGQDPAPALFDEGRVGVEFGFGALVEAWNLNDTREYVADGTLGIWWAFASRASLLVEFHATRVFQDAPRNAFVTAVAPVFRIKAVDRDRWDLFAEASVGAMWSDTTVPDRGTRFNYLGFAGLGVTRAMTDQTSVTTGVRWWHLSNNSLEGRDRDPDIQAIGGFVALTIGF